MAPDVFRILVQSEQSNIPVYTNDRYHGLCFPTVIIGSIHNFPFFLFLFLFIYFLFILFFFFFFCLSFFTCKLIFKMFSFYLVTIFYFYLSLKYEEISRNSRQQWNETNDICLYTVCQIRFCHVSVTLRFYKTGNNMYLYGYHEAKKTFKEIKDFEPHHEKTWLCHMRTTKAQISLRIRSVWTAPLFRCLDSKIPLLAISKTSKP